MNQDRAQDTLSPLTAPERVLISDVWNKFLAAKDMLIEMFFERLLYEEPELLDCFGDAVDLVPGYFAELFDRSVRQLTPRPEHPRREGYRGIYPAPAGENQSVDDYAELLADLGMRSDHWMTARRIWVWTLLQIPNLEDYDRENLTKGVHSATYRFFTLHLLPPALDAIRQYDSALTPDTLRNLHRCGDIIAPDALAIGSDFHRLFFQLHPDLPSYFGRTDTDSLARQVVQAIVFLVQSLDAGQDVRAELRALSRTLADHDIPPEAYSKAVGPLLAVMKQRVPDFTTELEHAWGLLLNRVSNVLQQPLITRQRMLGQAGQFLRQVAEELDWEPLAYDRRWNEIEREIRATGSYTHTHDELVYGAQLAWRNSAKCIGRIAWRNMIVRDLRQVTDPDLMFRECAEHLRLGTNDGNLQIVMNVFRPKQPGERWGPRIWNGQYIRFAAYEQEDGTLLGDGANKALTQAIIRQGWCPPATKTAYDCLPLVIEVPGHKPRLYEFAAEDILKVPLEHPAYSRFAALGLQWCAIPAIANFRMEIGGVHYGCAPFNGWFMETEIARNLWEEGRYNKAEVIAQAMGFDTSSEQTLWRDRAFLELNAAVLHSFLKAKVTLVDHQTAARQFLTHDLREKRAGRECPAQWSWVVPSAGGSTTPVWHHEMRDFLLSPNFHYAADKWAVLDTDLLVAGEQEDDARSGANRLLILYGSETGTAEGYARQTARRLSRHRPRVMALDDYDVSDLSQESVVLVVISTFGNGGLPGNAKSFYDWIRAQPSGVFNQLTYSVMALGSTVYAHFCAAGITLDRELARIGGARFVALHQGDEIKGQAGTLRQWLDLVAHWLGEDPSHPATDSADGLRFGVQFLGALDDPTSAHKAGRQRLPGMVVPVVANRELLKEVIVGSRSTRFMAFDIAGTDMTYETGDHVAIYPHNPPILVQRLCNRLGVKPTAWFRTTLLNRADEALDGDNPYPEPVSLRQVLTEEVDLSLREPYIDLIQALFISAEEPGEKAHLKSWCETLAWGEGDTDCQALKKHLADTFITVADLLEAFPSARLSFAQLIDLLPKQKPRLYSISSCSLVHPTQVHITVGVVQVLLNDGRMRSGLCSNYLAGLDPDQNVSVRIAIRTSTFRPPPDPQSPMLLVGPGTGLSPLVGFLQHREVQLQALHRANAPGLNGDVAGQVVRPGHARLYFGCRDLNDYLYQQELETWHEAGVLTHLDVAFSRLGEERIYVQDLIGKHRKDLWEVLAAPDCYYYVCGDAKMADEVFQVLMIIAQTEGGLSEAEAIRFFQTMQAENRFVTDVWGVLLNVPHTDGPTAQYPQGERWLGHISAHTPLNSNLQTPG